MLNDGRMDRLTERRASGTPIHPVKYTPLTAGNSTVAKGKGLKADQTAANGGIGVSYSNVMLGGLNTVTDPGAAMPKSTYKGHYMRNGHHGSLDINSHSPLSPDNLNN